MDESQIVDIWLVFRESIDKKNIEMVAERYVDVCADFGASDEAFSEALGNCTYLDYAINYYLDDDDIDEDDYDEWDDYWAGIVK